MKNGSVEYPCVYNSRSLFHPSRVDAILLVVSSLDTLWKNEDRYRKFCFYPNNAQKAAPSPNATMLYSRSILYSHLVLLLVALAAVNAVAKLPNYSTNRDQQPLITSSSLRERSLREVSAKIISPLVPTIAVVFCTIRGQESSSLSWGSVSICVYRLCFFDAITTNCSHFALLPYNNIN